MDEQSEHEEHTGWTMEIYADLSTAVGLESFSSRMSMGRCLDWLLRQREAAGSRGGQGGMTVPGLCAAQG